MNYIDIVKSILTGTIKSKMTMMTKDDRIKVDKFKANMQKNFNESYQLLEDKFEELFYDAKNQNEFSQMVCKEKLEHREFLWQFWQCRNKSTKESMEWVKKYMTQKMGDSCCANKFFERRHWIIKNIKIDDITPACYAA